MAIATTNPANGEVLKTFEAMSPEQVDAAPGRGRGRLRHAAPNHVRRSARGG